MRRRPYEPELMGAAEAAITLGVEQTNVRTVAGGLPEPYQKIKATTLWRADEIRALAAERGRATPITDHHTKEDDDGTTTQTGEREAA